MSDNFSTQFPKPPDLQPIPSPQPRIWRIVSLLFILSGLSLLGAGGWMFYQYQLEASKPPPARILEVTVPGETDTSAPQPSLAAVEPEATPAQQPPVEIVAENPAPSTINTVPAATPTLVEDIAALEDLIQTPAPTPITSGVQLLTPVPTWTPSPAPPTAPPQPTATAAPALSLAENPLVVAEDEVTPAPAVPAPAPAPAEMPVVSPPTRIVAESIGMDAPVVEVGWVQVTQDGVSMNVWAVADYAAGWHKNSTLPGQGGNVVLSGHHNIKGEVFRYIIDMNIGDLITLYVGDQPYQYTVVDKFIVKDKDEPEAVRRENAKWIGPFNEERLTLVTCWPYTNNTHRAIVIAKPVNVVQGTN